MKNQTYKRVKPNFENQENMISTRNIETTFSKTVPSRVFFNHFFAINYRILSDPERHSFRTNDFFNNNCKILSPETFNLEKVRNLLWNSWSTEYALKTTQMTGNQEFYKFALHWSFPQAYYSTYLAMTAFHHVQNKANNIHEKSIKIFGTDINSGVYPESISFYTSGGFNSFRYHGLPNFREFPAGFSGLPNIQSLEDAEQQIALFLKTTRTKNAEERKEKYYESKHKSFLSSKKLPLTRYSEEHWNIIYNSLHYTSIMNLLYRLRIKANYHDIESFLNAEIDFELFHQSISNIVSHLNFIHESYIAKAIGTEQYANLIYNFPCHMFEENAKTRYENLILELVK